MHYTPHRICEHKPDHVMHYTPIVFVSTCLSMWCTILPRGYLSTSMWCNARCQHAQPQVWKFSPLSSLITTAFSSLMDNHHSFHLPIPTSHKPQPSTVTTPGFLWPIIGVCNIPNLLLPLTPIQCHDVPAVGGTNMHQTLMGMGEGLYAVPAGCAWWVIWFCFTLYSILSFYANWFLNKPIGE